MKLMVIAPHPDDAELSIGGSMYKFSVSGHSVCLVDLTDGEPTPYGSPEKRKRWVYDKVALALLCVIPVQFLCLFWKTKTIG